MKKISSADIIILTISIFSARIRASISFSCLSSFVSDVQNIISEVKSPKFAWSENVNLDEKLRNSTHLPYVALKLRCGAARGDEHIPPLAILTKNINTFLIDVALGAAVLIT